jgi:hypothetical protein
MYILGKLWLCANFRWSFFLRITWVWLLPTLIAVPGFAEVKLKHATNGDIFLIAESCLELQEEVEAVARWSRSRGETPFLTEMNCERTPDLKIAEIRNLIPTATKQIYGIYPKCDGPNCFNTALLDAKLLKYPRHTGVYEWKTQLSKCKLRGAHERPLPGDLATIRERVSSRDYDEVHGFTHVGKLACSKNGMYVDSACLLEPINDLLNTYGFTDQAECFNPSLDQIPESCDVFVSYYDCSSIDKKFHPSPLLSAVEQKISCSAMNGVDASFLQIATLIELVESSFQSHSVSEVETKAALLSADHQMEFLNFRDHMGDPVRDKSELNQKDHLGRSLLYLASRYGKEKAFRELVNAGADLSSKTKNGNSVFHGAAYSNNSEILNFLVGFPKIKYLLDKKNKEGKTPLQIAALNGKAGAFKRLLKAGAKLKSKDDNRNSVLHDAIVGGNVEIFEVLIQAGANLNKKNAFGYTPLALAKKYSRNQLIHYLKAMGAKDH